MRSLLKMKPFIGALALVMMFAPELMAQPVIDSIQAIQKQNDRVYRVLNSLDDQGGSYAYTNVIQWKVTDPELYNQLKDALQKDPFNLKPEDVDITDIYLFAAPIPGTDRVQPFHILAMGLRKAKSTGKKKTSALDVFGGGSQDNGQPVPFPFKGKTVVRYLVRNKALLDNINAIQGQFVEMPGEIIPHGAQLVKDTRIRYMFNKMFTQFYSKKAILDEQHRLYGLPTSEEEFAAPATATDSTAAAAPQAVPLIDPEETTSLPDDENVFLTRAARYEHIVDLSVNHLWVNVSRQVALELELGNSEVGLPVWSTGQARFWINLKNQIGSESNVKLGLIFPLDFGNSDAFTFPARKLSGSFGGSLDAYFAGINFFSAFDLPLALKLSVMPSQGSNSSIIYNGQPIYITALDGTQVPVGKDTSFYRTTFIGQLYIPTILQLDLNNFIQFSVGVGLLNVQQSIIPTKNMTLATRTNGHPWFTADQVDKIQDLARVSAEVSPHLMVEYVNHKNSKFGLSAGYDHEFMFGGWIELIQDHLRLELSYSAPLIRDPKPWEPTQFFSITPRFYF